MKPDPTANKRNRTLLLLGVLVVILLTVLILLQSSNVWKNFTVESASDTLLLYALSSLNFIAFMIFGFIFLRNLIKLVRERRALQLGSQFKTRLLLYFAAVSLLPIIAMAGFSYLFMNRAIERWFSQIPENVVRAVEQRAIADQNAKLNETARMAAVILKDKPVGTAELAAVADAGNITFAAVLDSSGRLVAASRSPIDQTVADELAAVAAGISGGAVVDPALSDGRGFDAASAAFADGRTLVLVQDTDTSIIQLVNQSLAEFDRLKHQQLVVQQVGFLTLGVLTFLLIFASTWTAFYIARGLTGPVKALAEGADEIAQGNFAHRVDVLAEDELALLVNAFNQMSAKLEENSIELGERRRYIETVLQSLPTGIISVDGENKIGTINRAAIKILRLENADFRGLSVDMLFSAENLAIIERVLSRAKRVGHAAEQTVLQHENPTETPDGGSMPAALTATALPDDGGVVLVIEDLSELIAAQRASAWQEIARRMAHEIKNPLTPIQLSAERIAKRFADKNGDSEAIHETDGQTVGVIQSGTATILREVESLKSMVNEFSRYARLPNAKLEPGNVNDIVGHVVGGYTGRGAEIELTTQLDPHLAPAAIDAEQIKRAIVNLVDNAIEAFAPDAADREVIIKTRNDAARGLIVIEVADNGTGFSPADIQKLFQPYFSTKSRGTGLGLAIVHRIVADHGGRIFASANQPQGARFVIELPASV